IVEKDFHIFSLQSGSHCHEKAKKAPERASLIVCSTLLVNVLFKTVSCLALNVRSLYLVAISFHDIMGFTDHLTLPGEHIEYFLRPNGFVLQRLVVSFQGGIFSEFTQFEHGFHTTACERGLEIHPGPV